MGLEEEPGSAAGRCGRGEKGHQRGQKGREEEMPEGRDVGRGGEVGREPGRGVISLKKEGWVEAV